MIAMPSRAISMLQRLVSLPCKFREDIPISVVPDCVAMMPAAEPPP